MTYPTKAMPKGDGTLSYAGTVIRKRGLMLKLTDMWRAADSPAARRPTQWLVLGETDQFRAYLHTRLRDRFDPKPNPNVVLNDNWTLDRTDLIRLW